MNLALINTITGVLGLGGVFGIITKSNSWYKSWKVKRDVYQQHIVSSLAAQDEQLKAIKYQLYPNGSMSMFDKVMAGLTDLQSGQVNTWELMDLAVWKSDKDGRITFVTNSLCEMIGCTVADVMDNSWVNRVIEKDRTAVFNEWISSVQTASEFNRTYTYRKSDGLYQTVNATAVHNKGRDGKVMSSAGRFIKQGEPFKI